MEKASGAGHEGMGVGRGIPCQHPLPTTISGVWGGAIGLSVKKHFAFEISFGGEMPYSVLSGTLNLTIPTPSEEKANSVGYERMGVGRGIPSQHLSQQLEVESRRGYRPVN